MVYVRSAKSGFTLIEILIAIAIVVIMGAIAIPSMFRYLDSSRKKATIAQLKSIKSVINQFNADTGQFPESLKDLYTRPANEEIANKWEGPYLESKETPKDGWGFALQYRTGEEGGQSENPFELYSYGSNRGPSTPKEKRLDVWKL